MGVKFAWNVVKVEDEIKTASSIVIAVIFQNIFYLEMY
jgi:hypothetical protein